ncbi:DUF3122 domain-containing protein [Limnofasciculus baicalensis]|uniref:DUF3122 domain-containing protein n=1 Tax=Limnofasciculus baicalensis BBK-W-15 TaxID=2699891 RepID=A0AAE3KRP7_9CYAN|nr:DUF3122 domain-containing protein [Limnofasciculus baicalensis]MCP2728657.1 DUF3122 domain-containing protein [Limnofasciculus baicalensis BBK-W-15]
MNSICFNESRIRPMRWLLAVLICVLLVVWSPLPAFAAVTQMEEYPGQMLYQSRQNLQDQNGNSWEVVAFKRIHPEGSATVSLRLVGFLSTVEFDRRQLLTLTTSLGQTLTAKDISGEIYQNIPTPANVAEYDILPILLQLQPEIPLQLTLPMVTGSSINLEIPSTVIQEWRTISDR